jgi:hypothetical protein
MLNSIMLSVVLLNVIVLSAMVSWRLPILPNDACPINTFSPFYLFQSFNELVGRPVVDVDPFSTLSNFFLLRR